MYTRLSFKEYTEEVNMNSFSVANIKSFENSGEIELKPITILAGKNSCGKSTLLRFPAVLEQTVEYSGINPPVSFLGNQIDYGNFEDIVYQKDQSRRISFSISYSFDISGNTRYYLGRSFAVGKKKDSTEDVRKVTLFITLKKIHKQIKVDQVKMMIDQTSLSCLTWDPESKKYTLAIDSYYSDNMLKEVSENIDFSNEVVSFEKFFPVYNVDSEMIKCIAKSKGVSFSSDTELEKLVKCCLIYEGDITRHSVQFTDEEKEIATTFMYFSYVAKIMTFFHNLFIAEYRSRVSYIGPFRNIPERIYRYSESSQRHVGGKGENASDILMTLKYSSSKQTVFSNVSEWLEKYFGYSLDLDELGNNYFQIVLKDKYSVKASITDVGFGISQVLPIILEVCLFADNQKKKPSFINDIILIEQPELHLHPAAQACLADLFAICISANPNARLIIETHSEHLISKLQVLIADPHCDLDNDMVQILYVDKNEDGSSYINNIGIDENGKFDREWPKDFFDQGFQLAMQLMKNAASRIKGKENG